MSRPGELIDALFVNKPIENSSDGSSITVTFDSPQTPADLGPLVRVELLPPDSP